MLKIFNKPNISFQFVTKKLFGGRMKEFGSDGLSCWTVHCSIICVYCAAKLSIFLFELGYMKKHCAAGLSGVTDPEAHLFTASSGPYYDCDLTV